MHHRFLAQLEAHSVSPSAPAGMTVTLKEISGILADAVNSRRTWLQDFAEDPIQIPSDLYDVLVAYQRIRKNS